MTRSVCYSSSLSKITSKQGTAFYKRTQKDLIAFDGTLYQVLDLPANPFTAANQKENQKAIAHLINQSFKEVDYAG